jgi:hypothetical protein
MTPPRRFFTSSFPPSLPVQSIAARGPEWPENARKGTGIRRISRAAKSAPPHLATRPAFRPRPPRSPGKFRPRPPRNPGIPAQTPEKPRNSGPDPRETPEFRPRPLRSPGRFRPGKGRGGPESQSPGRSANPAVIPPGASGNCRCQPRREKPSIGLGAFAKSMRCEA